VRGTPVVVGGPESDIEEARDPEGREVVFGADDVSVIYTGVPRAGRDEKYLARLEREREVPNKPLPQPRVETSSVPPPLLKPSPQPERPPQPKRIVVQTRECRDYDDAGEVVEGYYDVKGGILYVWNARDNAPIGNQPVSPCDNVELIARRLLREKSGKHSSFYQPIRYPRGSVH